MCVCLKHPRPAFSCPFHACGIQELGIDLDVVHPPVPFQFVLLHGGGVQ